MIQNSQFSILGTFIRSYLRVFCEYLSATVISYIHKLFIKLAISRLGLAS